MMSDADDLVKLRRMKELQDKAGAGSTTAEEPSFLDKLASYVPDAVKNVGTAAYKGAAGLVASAGDALAGSYDLSDAVRASAGLPVRTLDKTGPVSAALESTGYQPKTQAEQYVNSAVRGATSALAGPGAVTGPARAAIAGTAGGLGGEVAAQLPGIKGTKGEGAARVAGALLGSIGGGLATLPFKNSKDLAAEMFNGVKPADVEAAKDLMAKSRIAGVPVNLDQAMGQDTNITNVVKALVGQKAGQPVVDQLRAQPAQVKTLTGRLTNILPGQVQEPAQIANTSQAAATDAITAARQARTDATAPLFQQAGAVPPDLIGKMTDQVLEAAKQAPDTNKGMLLSNLAQVLKSAKDRATPASSGLLDAQGNPIMAAAQPIDIQELNGSLRSILNNAKNINLSSSANDKEAIGALTSHIADIRNQLGEVSPNFKAGNQLYSDISANTVDPLKKSVVGRVAGLTGDLSDKEAVNKLLPLLAKGRNPDADTSDITKFAQETSSTPEVFQNAVKTNFSNAVAAAEKQVNGNISSSLPAALEKTLLGDASKRQGLKDQLEAVAVHQGFDKDAIYPGFMAAMKIISASAKRPGTMGPNGAALDEIAGQSLGASGLKMIGLAPGKPAAAGLQNYLSADAYRTLAENLTTPEGVAKLQALAKTPVMSVKAQNILNSLLVTQGAASEGNSSPEVRNNTSGGVSVPGQ